MTIKGSHAPPFAAMESILLQFLALLFVEQILRFESLQKTER